MQQRRTPAFLLSLMLLLTVGWLVPGAATAQTDHGERDVIRIDNSNRVRGETKFVRGTVNAAVIDGRKGSRTLYAVQTDSALVRIKTNRQLPDGATFAGWVTTGQTSRVMSAQVTATAAAPVSSVGHTAYVAMPNGVGTYPTNSEIASYVDTALGHWAADLPTGISSFTRSGAITSYDSTQITAANCGNAISSPNAVWAEAAAAFPGVDFASGTNHLVVLLPQSCEGGLEYGAGSPGSANGGGKVLTFASTKYLNTLIHTLGHNLGFGHGNLYNNLTMSEDDACDVYSVMGLDLFKTNLTSLDTGHRVLLGYDGTGEVQTFPSSTVGSTTVTLTARGEASGLRGLRLVEPGTNKEFFVDYRGATGRDAGSLYAPGTDSVCQKRFAPGLSLTAAGAKGGETALFAAPGGQAFIGVGQSISSPSQQITVSLNSMSGATASVTVNYTPLANFSAAPKPTIVGTVAKGNTVTASAAGWSPTPEGQTYQWLIYGTPAYTETGELATGPSFTILDSDVGQELSVRVTSTKSGYIPTTTTSNPVVIAGPAVIASAPKPTVTGYPRVAEVLTANPGTYPVGADVGIEWQQSVGTGWELVGYGNTLTLTPALLGKTLRVRVVATMSGFTSTEAFSANVGPILEPFKQLTVGSPYFTGRLKTYRYLTAYPGTWTTGTTFKYQWNADGVPIYKATGKRLYLRKAQRGKMITVTVTGSQSGYKPVSVTSPARGPVLR